MLFIFNISFLLLSGSKPALIELGAVTFGGVAGYTSGYFLKKIFKVILIIMGLVFVLMQLLSHYELIVVNWANVKVIFDSFTNNQENLNSLQGILISNLPAGGGFIAGLILGLKKG